ncbi:Imm30 family immunity protein [Acinetobacter sp. ANC 5502]
MIDIKNQIIAKLANFNYIDESNIDELANVLHKISTIKDQSFILPLLLLLNDDCDFDEIIFGIIHTLEKFPWNQYFTILLSNIDYIYEKSPKWCYILHTRIINSDTAYEEFLSIVLSASKKIKITEQNILMKISEKDKFRACCLYGINKIAE